MSLKAGIVGLPNVGKSTLFNAITKQQALAANYPFATIEPNVGVVTVPDKRLDFLNDMYLIEDVNYKAGNSGFDGPITEEDVVNHDNILERVSLFDLLMGDNANGPFLKWFSDKIIEMNKEKLLSQLLNALQCNLYKFYVEEDNICQI